MHRAFASFASRLALLAGLAVASAPGAAQQGAAASAEPAASAPAKKLRAQSPAPGSAAYPAELASQGVQGTTDVLVAIGADGAPVAVSVHASSGSAALDELALGFVRGLRFRAPGAAAGAALPDVILPVEFLRDSVEGLQTKRCADFNVDADYFRATFPDTDPSRMPVIRMTTGMLLLTGTSRSSDAMVAMARQLAAAAKGIAAACRAAPDAHYLQTFVDLVKQAG